MKGIIPQGKPWTQNRFGGSIPLKTAKLFKGQGYGFLRPRMKPFGFILRVCNANSCNNLWLFTHIGNGTIKLVPLLSFV